MTALATVDSASRPAPRQRVAGDFYREPESAVHALIDAETLVGRGWDPAAGSGTIPRVIRARTGLPVLATDIVERGAGCFCLRDFLDDTWFPSPDVDFIATNPPFAYAEQFIARAMKVVRHKAAFLLRLSFLEGRGRRERIYDKLPLARVHVFSGRISMPPGDSDVAAKGGAVAFAWFVFEVGHRGPPQLGWVG